MLTHATAWVKLEGITLSDMVSHMHKKIHYDSIYMRYFSSVAQLCPTLCDPVDCSIPGLPVYHLLPEFTQTHVH